MLAVTKKKAGARRGRARGLGKVKGSGRKAGTPNKWNASVKDMVLQSLNNVGGVKYLDKMAKQEPRAYLTLVGKLVPTEVTGAGGAALIPAPPPEEVTRDAARRIAHLLSTALQMAQRQPVEINATAIRHKPGESR